MLTKVMFLVAVVVIGYQVYPKASVAPAVTAPTEIYVGGSIANLPSGTFRVTNLVNYKDCRVADDLTSACQERKLPAPDEIVLRLNDSAEGKTFELSSFCRHLYGRLRPAADDQIKVEIAAENDTSGAARFRSTTIACSTASAARVICSSRPRRSRSRAAREKRWRSPGCRAGNSLRFPIRRVRI